jgi:glycosyl transferase family 25
MRTFVISLKTQVERRDWIRQQLESLGVDFQFFDAVDLRQDRTAYFRAVDVGDFHLNAGRNPLTNEIGCYASHLTLWRTCRALGEPIIVLEDDACLTDDFRQALGFVEAQVKRLGFIRLEANPYTPSIQVARSRHFAAAYCSRYPYSAMAYAIAPNVAAAFINRSTRMRAPVDKFIKDFWVHGQPLHQLIPAVVTESEIGKVSTIGHRQKPRRRRLRSRLLRAGVKLGRCFRRWTFNLRYRSAHICHAYRKTRGCADHLRSTDSAFTSRLNGESYE